MCVCVYQGVGTCRGINSSIFRSDTELQFPGRELALTCKETDPSSRLFSFPAKPMWCCVVNSAPRLQVCETYETVPCRELGMVLRLVFTF